MSKIPEGYRWEPIPRSRRFTLDAGYLGRRAHIMHGLLEIDVTRARDMMRRRHQATGEKLSFTAFIINCLAQAIVHNPHVHAYRDWRNRLVIFDDVNITAMVEVDMNGKLVPMPHVFKAVNRRSLRDIHQEMRGSKAAPQATAEAGFMHWFLALPAFLRRIFYRIIIRFPHTLRSHSSPVMVTAVGMFGSGSGWGIPLANFTLTVTLGTIAKKPGVVDDQIQIREYLHMTISIDHDIVDGAPAARFMEELRQLIEGGYGLKEEGWGNPKKNNFNRQRKTEND